VAYFEVSVRTLVFDRVFCCWMWHSAASLVHVGVLGRDWGCIRSGLGLHRNHTSLSGNDLMLSILAYVY